MQSLLPIHREILRAFATPCTHLQGALLVGIPLEEYRVLLADALAFIGIARKSSRNARIREVREFLRNGNQRKKIVTMDDPAF